MNFIHLSLKEEPLFHKSHTLHSGREGESVWHSTLGSHGPPCQDIPSWVSVFYFNEIKAGSLLFPSLADQQKLHSPPPPDPVLSGGGTLPPVRRWPSLWWFPPSDSSQRSSSTQRKVSPNAWGQRNSVRNRALCRCAWRTLSLFRLLRKWQG